MSNNNEEYTWKEYTPYPERYDDIITPNSEFSLFNIDWDFSKEDSLFGYNMEEKINHPAHYTQGSIECIDALEAATVNLTGIDAVCTANSIKYLWRWKQKGGVDDLKKAKWYLDKLITRWENQ